MKTENALATWKRVNALEERRETLPETITRLQVRLAALKREHEKHMRWYSDALHEIRTEASGFGINLNKEQPGNPPCVEGTCYHEACREARGGPVPIVYALKKPSWVQRLIDFILGRY